MIDYDVIRWNKTKLSNNNKLWTELSDYATKQPNSELIRLT